MTEDICMNNKVTKDTMISEAIRYGMPVVFLLKNFGMECMHCNYRLEETLEQAAIKHNIDPNQLIGSINYILDDAKHKHSK